MATSQAMYRVYQNLEEVKKDSNLEALEGTWPCQQLDFILLVSRNVRKEICVV